MMDEGRLLRRLSLIEFLHFFAWQVAVPIIPLHLAAQQYDSLTIGLVVSAFGIPAALFGLMVGMAVDRWGPHRAQRLGLSAMATGAVLLAVSRDYLPGMVIAQVIMGLAQLLGLVATQSWLAASVRTSGAQKAFGWLTFASGSGWIVGPLLGGYLAEHWSYATALGTAAALQLLPLVISLRLPHAREARSVGRDSGAPLAKSRAILQQPSAVMALLVTFGIMFAYSLRDAILPLFLQDRGFTASQIGMALGAMGITSVGIRPFLGAVGQHSWRLLTAIVATAAMGLAVLPVWSSVVWMVGVALLLGLAVGMSNPMTTTIMSQSTPPESRGMALSLRFVANRFAQLSNPLGLGWIAATMGLQATFIVPALLMGGLAVVMLRVHPETESRLVNSHSNP